MNIVEDFTIWKLNKFVSQWFGHVLFLLAFTQLLTDLDEYTGDLTNVTLPYFDFQTYMMKTVLSGLEDTLLSSKVASSHTVLPYGAVTVLTWLTIHS